MASTMVIQGRELSSAEVAFIRQLLGDNPDWPRTRLSQELCEAWDWRNAAGQLKDMACRSLLRKLETAGEIALPPPRRPANNELRQARTWPVPPPRSPLESSLAACQPVVVRPVTTGPERELLAGFLAHYHYLGYSGTVGENLQYVAWDGAGEPLACLLFGAAAWRVAGRDAFIGWEETARRQRLPLVANNMRFLILPWVRVPHLASHLLGQVARRVSEDWRARYGHPIQLLETYVQRERFRGTAYRAANWIHVGVTQGRSRNDRDGSLRVPRKDVYVYPLSKRFRQELCRGA